MVDGLEGVCPLTLAPKEAGAQDERIHVVRRLAELLVHELQGFGLIVLFLQDLVGLGEVVSVLSLILLGVGGDTRGGQDDGGHEDEDVFHVRERVCCWFYTRSLESLRVVSSVS